MKRSTVVVPWPDGLKFRSAARIIRAAKKCQSAVVLHCGDRIADVRSIVGIVMLCAMVGTSITIEASGGDEQKAIEEVERVFVPVLEDEE
jgi:phosphocarrier protein HPr